MSLLTPCGLPTRDRLGNPILTSYRNMIRLESLYAETEIQESERLFHSLVLLYGYQIPDNLPVAMEELNWFYHCGVELSDSTGIKIQSNTTRLYDFEEDAACIYASFWHGYGIDLANVEKMHWWKFMALFTNLPDDTRMAQRMHYRGLDTSKMSKDMKKHYEQIKKQVALKSNRISTGASLAEIEKMNKQKVQKMYADAKKRLTDLKGGCV